jgi:hypothetical protein
MAVKRMSDQIFVWPLKFPWAQTGTLAGEHLRDIVAAPRKLGG